MSFEIEDIETYAKQAYGITSAVMFALEKMEYDESAVCALQAATVILEKGISMLAELRKQGAGGGKAPPG